MKKIITTILALTVGIFAASAQESDRKWEFDARVGVNIGGTSPLPLPREIRKIESYSPQFSPSVEINATRLINSRWGIGSGIRVEKKAMSTHAQVKDYRTEIIGEGGNKLRGNWTGDVHTNVENWYISIPVQALYRLNSRIEFTGGLFAAYLIDGSFDGYVNDGYLRKDNPTGDKIVFDKKDKGTYDFSNEINSLSWGVQAGAHWSATRHIRLSAQLTWGVNELFKSNFKTISFSMYPIYLNIAAGYRF